MEHVVKLFKDIEAHADCLGFDASDKKIRMLIGNSVQYTRLDLYGDINIGHPCTGDVIADYIEGGLDLLRKTDYTSRYSDEE